MESVSDLQVRFGSSNSDVGSDDDRNDDDRMEAAAASSYCSFDGISDNKC